MYLVIQQNRATFHDYFYIKQCMKKPAIINCTLMICVLVGLVVYAVFSKDICISVRILVNNFPHAIQSAADNFENIWLKCRKPILMNETISLLYTNFRNLFWLFKFPPAYFS